MVVTVLAVSVILAQYGMLPIHIVVFAAYLLVGIAFPGVFAWRALLQRLHREDDPPTWFEDLSLGTSFGFGVQLPVYLVGVIIGVPLLVIAVPAVAAVVSLTPYGRRIWTLPTGRLDWRASWVFAAVAVFGFWRLARHVFRLQPLYLPAFKVQNIDETFHQALVAELSHRFPPEIPFLLGTRLDYHWFVHAQLAATRWVTGLDTVLLLRQLLPALLIPLTVCGLGAVTLRLTRRPAAAVVAPALLVVGGFDLFGPHYDARQFSESFLTPRYVSSPSQSYGVMMSMPALMLLLEVLRPDRKASKATWVTLAMALLALSGSKATFMPVFLCGAAAVWLYRLVVDHRVDRTASALVGLVFAVTVFAQVVLFGMQSGAMRFSPGTTLTVALNSEGIAVTKVSAALMAATLLIGWLLYGAGALGLAQQRRWRDPRALFMLAAVPAGVAVPFLFYRSGLSQMWFQRATAGMVVLLSAWGLSYLLPSPLTRRAALRLAGIAAASGLVAFGISVAVEDATDPGGQSTFASMLLTVLAVVGLVVGFAAVAWVARRRRGQGPGLLVLVTMLLGLGLTNVYAVASDVVTGHQFPPLTFQPMFAPGGEEAAAYIRDHSDPYDVVATNIHCVSPTAPVCDNRGFWVAGLTERRVVIQGWGYTAATNGAAEEGGNNAKEPVPDPQRLAMNNLAFEFPSEETVGRLVDTYGVDWLFVSKEYPVDIAGLDALTSMLDKQFENRHYIVYKVID